MASGSGGEEWKKRSYESDKDQRVPPERTPEKEILLQQEEEEKEQEKEQISPGKSSEKERVSPEEGLDKEPTASDSASTLEAKKLNLLPEVKYLTKELDLEHVDLHNLPHMVDPEQYYSYSQVTETSEKPLDSPAEVSVVVEKTAQSTENVSIGSGKSVLMTLLKESHSVGGLKKTDEPEKPDLVFNKEKAVCTFKLPPPNIETKNMGNLDQNTSPVGTLAAMDPSTEPLNYNQKNISNFHRVIHEQEHGRNIPDNPRPLKGPRTTTEDELFHTAPPPPPPPPPPPNSQESAPETGLSTSAAITNDSEKDAAWYQFAIFEAMAGLRDQSEGCNDNDIAKRILEKYKVVPVNFKMEVMRHHVGELYMKGILTVALKGFRLKGIPFETWSKQYDALKKKMEKAKKA